ncbi:MAG: tetratricopeptide repeat protein [Deltaproteobacteria bacterium]
MAMPAGGQKPSASEIAALEQTFAQDPTSEAYRSLAEAYLTLGRFMEAMVVSKKGIKARPQEATPRVLLARIYAEQGKDPKALEELQGALSLQPSDIPALRLLASLQFKAGQTSQGGETVLKAHAAAPNDPGVLELMARFGVHPPAPPPPPVVVAPPSPPPAATPSPEGPPVLLPAGALPPRASAQRMAPAPSLSRAGSGASAGARAGAAAGPRAAPPPSGARAAPVAPTRRAAPLDLSRYEDEDEEPRQAGLGRGALTSVMIGVLCAAGLVGWVVYKNYANRRDRQVTKLLKQTKDELAKDDYAGYQAAEKLAQQVLDLDPTNFAADAYLAYIDALRYGENGEGGDYLKRAQESLARAKQKGQPHAYIYAADAYLHYYTGDPKGAEALLEAVLHDSAGGQRSYNSDLLSGVLGIVQMGEGKLAEARKSLLDAHNLAPADVRITAALGKLDARLDSSMTAAAFFQQALHVDADHVPSLLGLALLELQESPPDVAGAQKIVTHLGQLGAGATSPRQSAFAKFVEAELLAAQGKSSEADEEEKLAMDLDQSSVEMPLIAGQRRLAAGQINRAMAFFQKALALDPNRPMALAAMGRAYLAQPGGAAKAVAQLREAVARAPQDAGLVVLLGNAYQKSGDVEHARESWQKALAVEPDNVDAHFALARYFLARGDAAKAKVELTAVAQRADGERLAEAESELGRMTLDAGDSAGATGFFSRAMQADPSYAPPYFYAGKMMMRDRAKKRDAKKFMAQYLKLAPTGPLASEARHLSR